MCPDCPVQAQMGYSNQFYCTRGNAIQQSGV
jgi:hypothetical protein